MYLFGALRPGFFSFLSFFKSGGSQRGSGLEVGCWLEVADEEAGRDWRTLIWRWILSLVLDIESSASEPIGFVSREMC